MDPLHSEGLRAEITRQIVIFVLRNERRTGLENIAHLKSGVSRLRV